MIKKYFAENLSPYLLSQKNICCQFYLNTRDYPIEHSHEDYWEFSVVLNGTIENNLNGKKCSYSQGTLFYCTTNDVHHVSISDKAVVRYVNFTIAQNALLQLLLNFSPKIQASIHKNERTFVLPSDMLFSVEQLLHKLNLLSQKQYAMTNDLILAQIMTFLQYIVTQLHADTVENEPSWIQELNRLKQQEDFITCTVDELCKKLNYSRVQLNRLFNAKFGTTPHEYLLSNKLLYAHNLLISTDMNTMDIANAIGYSNLAQFNVVFKKRFGVTPGQYRKELAIGQAPSANEPTL